MFLSITYHTGTRYATAHREKDPGAVLPLPYIDAEGKGRKYEWSVPDSNTDEMISVPGVGVIAQILVTKSPHNYEYNNIRTGPEQGRGRPVVSPGY